MVCKQSQVSKNVNKQLIFSKGKQLEKSEIAQNVVEELDDKDENKLINAYKQTFDLVDADNSGELDKDELMQWLAMCGAELDLNKITTVLTEEGNLSREKFATLMCSWAANNRRDYDISGTIKSSH